MTLTTVDGGTVSSADFPGKVVVINVWGTWCPPCRNELPDFDRIATEYDGEVVILAVHSNSGKSNAPSFINANFPDSKIVFAYDTPEESYHSLIGGTVYYPRTVILDKEGVITYADDGAISYSYLKQLVTEAGAEK
jgi:thiol-disulfide isomerase/thioredoxin